MPVYEYRCAGGHRFERFLKLESYKEPQSCSECGQIAEKLISAPFIRPDITPFRSPIDDRWIDSRAQRREDMLRNGCVEWDADRTQEQSTRRRQADEQLEGAMEETFDAELSKLPTRKKEILVQELHAGASVEMVRSTPQQAALV